MRLAGGELGPSVVICGVVVVKGLNVVVLGTIGRKERREE